MTELEKEVEALKQQVEDLKEVVINMTEALRILTEKEERAIAFQKRVEEIVGKF